MLEEKESELLSAYTDNELVGQELIAVREKLLASVEWREELERLGKTKALAMGLPRMAAPTDLLDFLEAQAIQHEKKPLSFWQRPFEGGLINTWTWAGALASVVVILAGNGLYQSHQKSFIDLEPLLAAHSQFAYGDSLFQQNVVDAAVYSSQIRDNEK